MAVVVPIVSTWNPSGLKRAQADMKRAEGGLNKFAALMKSFGPLIGIAAAAGVAKLASESIELAREMRRVNETMDQVAQSMNLFGDDTDEVTARLRDYAAELEMVTATSDEVIKETQTILLTFKDLAATADEVGGSFDRATQLALDLAAAGFGSVSDNAKQLGKVLQDPIAQMSALSRSGVTFTETEKEMIKTLVETNKQLEAQDLILKAVESQVGGAAAAAADFGGKMSIVSDNLKEAFGEGLLSSFDSSSGKANEFMENLNDLQPLMKSLGRTIGEQAAELMGLVDAFNTLAEATSSFTGGEGENAIDWMIKLGRFASPAKEGLLQVATAFDILWDSAANRNFEITMEDQLRITGKFGQSLYETLDQMGLLSDEMRGEYATALAIIEGGTKTNTTATINWRNEIIRLRDELFRANSEANNSVFAQQNFQIKAANKYYRDAGVRAQRLAEEIENAADNTERAAGSASKAADANDKWAKKAEKVAAAFDESRQTLEDQIAVVESLQEAYADAADSVDDYLRGVVNIGAAFDTNLKNLEAVEKDAYDAAYKAAKEANKDATVEELQAVGEAAGKAAGAAYAGTWLDEFKKQIEQANGLDAALNAVIQSLNPADTLGNERLIEQLLALPPGVAESVAADIVRDGIGPALAADLSSLEFDAGTAWAEQFYGAGLESANNTLTAISDQVKKDLNKYRKIGKKAGDAFMEGYRAAVAGLPAGYSPTRTAAAANTRSAATYNVTVNAPLGDPIAVSRALDDVLRKSERRTGGRV